MAITAASQEARLSWDRTVAPTEVEKALRQAPERVLVPKSQSMKEQEDRG